MITCHWAQVTLYDKLGGLLQQIDFSTAAEGRDFTCVAFNPGGDVAVLGGFDCLTACSLNAQAGVWEMSNTKKVNELLIFLYLFIFDVYFQFNFIFTFFDFSQIMLRSVIRAAHAMYGMQLAAYTPWVNSTAHRGSHQKDHGQTC